MVAQPRLNSVIRALEEGKTAIATFVSPPSVEGAIALSTTTYDGVVFEYEHNPYDIKDLRDCLQYMVPIKTYVVTVSDGAVYIDAEAVD